MNSKAKILKYGTALSASALLGYKPIVNEPNDKKLSIYDNKVLELVYLEDKPSRLESKIRELRLQTNERADHYKSIVQTYVDKFIRFERCTQKFFLDLVPKEEKLLPNSLYVGISTLFGSILARNRFVLLRIASPITFGIASSYFLLPGTTNNVFKKVAEAYRQNEHLIKGEASTFAEPVKDSYTSPELDIKTSKNSNLPLESSIKEVEAMYTTRGDPGVRPVLERKEKEQ